MSGGRRDADMLLEDTTAECLEHDGATPLWNPIILGCTLSLQ